MPSRAFCLNFAAEICILAAKIPRGPAMNVYHKRPEADPEAGKVVEIEKLPSPLKWTPVLGPGR